jgi:hypothetical protein
MGWTKTLTISLKHRPYADQRIQKLNGMVLSGIDTTNWRKKV